MDNYIAIDPGTAHIGIAYKIDGKYSGICFEKKTYEDVWDFLDSTFLLCDVCIIEDFSPNTHDSYIAHKEIMKMGRLIGRLEILCRNNGISMIHRQSFQIVNKNVRNGKMNIEYLDGRKELTNVNYKNKHIRDALMHLLHYEASLKSKIDMKKLRI